MFKQTDIDNQVSGVGSLIPRLNGPGVPDAYKFSFLLKTAKNRDRMVTTLGLGGQKNCHLLPIVTKAERAT